MNQSLQKLAGELDANLRPETPNEVRRKAGLPPLPKETPAQKPKPTQTMAVGDSQVDQQSLPPDRMKAVEYGIAQFQQVAHERDELRKEVAIQREYIAKLEIDSEALRGQLNEAQSRITTAMLTRDQALADRIKYEGLFVSIQAQMRAFAVPATPLISDADFGAQQ